MADAEPDRTEHLSVEEATGYLDGTLANATRGTVEAHLAECRECRDELFEVSRLTRLGSAAPWWYVLVPVAAAAAVALLMLRAPADRAGGGPVRSVDEGLQRFEVIQPNPEAAVRADSVLLVWRSAGATAHYRVTITQRAGEPVWQGETADTALMLAVPLEPGASYFWFVDALLADGETATSGVWRFSTMR